MSTTLKPDKVQHQLDAFLVHNRDLESLSARLARFNLFSVLKIQKAEIRHSNVLAWLLTPGETHGLGDRFLRRFFSQLLMEKEINVTLTPAQVELMNLNDVQVDREWRNIDLFVCSYSDDWALHIENKIGAKEKPGALLKYRQAVRDEMPTAQIVSVFLTIDGEEPSKDARNEGYVALSHVDVLELAERIIEQNAHRIPKEANTFLAQYLDTLRRLTMQDEELVDLCRTIYRKHREAIDLIVEYGTSSEVMDMVEEGLRDLIDCEFVIRRGSKVWFLPNDLGAELKNLPPAAALSGWDHLSREVPVMWWFEYSKKKDRLGLVLEVGPIADGNTRKRLLEAGKREGFSFSEKMAFKDGAKFTRILSKRQKLKSTEDGDAVHDPEYVKRVAKALWKDLGAEGAKITGVLKHFKWAGAD